MVYKFHSCQILSPSKTGFIGSAHKLITIITLFTVVSPVLIQSDSPSRKRPFSTGFFFDWWILLVLLIVSRVDFEVFVLFLEVVGVRAYFCTAVEIGWQLSGSHFLRDQWLDEPSSQRVGDFGLGESR